ncbi:MAG: DNA mismatch repair protein MutS [Defluviitaleaceae bacterium]|nr:DNA mismatch repair protein MutS [Defluviitaleaceae bacterium]MCL2274710.1 DNA mismatch repair protein MutS [Defluviitaleaceae bacterium]
MFQLDAKQLEAIGFSYVLNNLILHSPYGAEKMKQLAPIRTREGVFVCLENIEKMLYLLAQRPLEMDVIMLQLMQLKNIRGCVEKCKVYTLTQVELFEIKQFLLAYEKLHLALGKLGEALTDIHFTPMGEALQILDADGLRLASFALDSPELRKIREEKSRAEAQQNTAARTAAVEQEVAEEGRILAVLSMALRVFVPDFLANMDAVGKLDFTLAKALSARETGAVKPQIFREGILVLENMYNPYVEEKIAHSGNLMTRVSVVFNRGTTVITGANMGGKSVALKTAVLNILLCQLGFYVFAEKMECPIFDDVYLLSEDMQDIGRGLSSFGAEMKKFAEISARLPNEKLFIAFDEFARGTNPTEGAAIVKAAAGFLAKTDSVSVITTHYDGVCSPVFSHYQVAGLSTPRGNSLCMDYRLLSVAHDAPPPQDALKICKMLGLEDVLMSLFGET